MRERVRGIAAQVVADNDIVTGRVGESLRGQFPFEFGGGIAFPEIRQYPRIIPGITDDRESRMVLGRGAQHGRTAHVDLLHGTFLGAIGIQDGGFERVEIDDQEIDPADAVFFGGGLVHTPARQQAAVNGGMKRLDAAVEDFRESGEFGNLQYLQSGFPQRTGRASCGNKLESEVDQAPGELSYAVLVGNADEGAAGPRLAAAHSSSRS